MKNRFLLLSLIAVFALGAASCGRMRHVSTTVLQPAQMNLPAHLSKVAVIDRSKPSNGWLNVLEGILTGEQIFQDRASRLQAVNGLTQALTRTPRFKVISTAIELEGSRTGGSMPQPLPWAEIERICQTYDADAVVAIESFDSDNLVSTRANSSRHKDKNGQWVTTLRFESEQRTSVRMAWRLYDPKTRTIIDEFMVNPHLMRRASGDTEAQALGNLPNRLQITREVAFLAGQNYGARIAPLYAQVSRGYYRKAKGYDTQMRQADSYAVVGNWERAASIWTKMVDHADNVKAKGRAAYNNAVAAEMEGNIDLALEWAEYAWTRCGNKKARHYVSILQRRKVDDARAARQMNKNT